MAYSILLILYSLFVTSNRKAVVLMFTTNNILVDLSYSSTRGFFRPSLEDNSSLWCCPSGEITTTLFESYPMTYTFLSLSTEIPKGYYRTRSSLYSHCVVPCKSQHVMCVKVCVVKFVTRSSYVVNARHITVDDITYRFITKI